MSMSTVAVSRTRLSNNCHVLTLVKRQVSDPNQLDLFAGDYSKQWIEQALHVAHKLPSTFWFSQLRSLVEVAPSDVNMWGALARALLKAGYKQTGRYRKSPIMSRRSGDDKEYERVSCEK